MSEEMIESIALKIGLASDGENGLGYYMYRGMLTIDLNTTQQRANDLLSEAARAVLSAYNPNERLREALVDAAKRLRETHIPSGRDERTAEYADGYEDACEMAADAIDEALSPLPQETNNAR